MSRQSKAAKRKIIAKQVTEAHNKGTRFGPLKNEDGHGKAHRYAGKSQAKRENR